MIQEPMTATEVNRSLALVTQRHDEMLQNRAALPTPPWYAGPNPHSKLPQWYRPILDMLLTGKGLTRL